MNDKPIYLINKIDNSIINSTINFKALFEYLKIKYINKAKNHLGFHRAFLE